MANTPWRPTVVQSLLAGILVVLLAILLVLLRMEPGAAREPAHRYSFLLAPNDYLIRCDPVTGEAWVTGQHNMPLPDMTFQDPTWVPIGTNEGASNGHRRR